MPSHTGTKSSSYCATFSPSAAETTHMRAPFLPSSAAACSASFACTSGSSCRCHTLLSSTRSGGPAAKSLSPASTMARDRNGGRSIAH